MKIILPVLILGLFASDYLYANEENQLVGEWKGNGEKTVEARIKSGSLKDKSVASKLIPLYSDETYIFTNTTVKISSASKNSTSTAIPYETIRKNDSSVTISFQVKNGKYSQLTFHFSMDENCIYVEREKYNDYFCKKL